MSIAAFLTPPPKPPHDPLWMILGGRQGWQMVDAPVVGQPSITPDTCGLLRLPPDPAGGRVPGEPSGALGGLALPGHMALDAFGTLWVSDRTRRVLRWLDPCRCQMVDAPCGGLGLIDPRALVAYRDRLYVVDAGPPGRVLVLEPRALSLRAIWQPAEDWSPTAALTDGDTLLVADAANGALHRFLAWGGHEDAQTGWGTVSRLVRSACGQIVAVVPGRSDVALRDTTGRIVDTVATVDDLRHLLPDAPLPVAPDGSVDIGPLCDSDTPIWIDADGARRSAPPPALPRYVTQASSVLGPLDSAIAGCVWHRVVLDAACPPGTAIRAETTTAEARLTDAMIAELPASAWTSVPLGKGGEALIQSQPGQLMWLRLSLQGDGHATPEIRRIHIEYPRITLRRYLPAAFGADPVSADFADRLLGVFDRGLRDIEGQIDDQAHLYDPRSTPATPDRDMLGWLAGWIGMALDRTLPEARRRRLLQGASRLLSCKGTVAGLRGALLLWLGWDRLGQDPFPPAPCAPACTPHGKPPPLPTLVLEHWRLRRWLHLGHGRLGDAARLWGAGLIRGSQLDGNARLDATQLDTARDPLREPFHRSAHRLSLFVPAHAVAHPPDRARLKRMLRAQVPAHVEATLVPVHPRMRIGIPAALGFDSVVGCWPAAHSHAVRLGQGQLGRASVLSGAAGHPGLPPRLGRDSHLTAPSSPDLREVP